MFWNVDMYVQFEMHYLDLDVNRKEAKSIQSLVGNQILFMNSTTLNISYLIVVLYYGDQN